MPTPRRSTFARLIAAFATSAAILALLGGPPTAVGEIFVTNNGNGTIGEYTNSGVAVNSALVTGLNNPTGIAVSGGNLFVGDFHNFRIGEYTTSGTTVNAALVTGLNGPAGIAVSGGNLFVVVNQPTGGAVIAEYTTSGTTVNSSLVSGLNSPIGIAESGGNLFVTDAGTNTIREYTTAGATVNAALVSGLHGPQGIAVSGGNLFVANASNGTIGEYTTSGATVNAALVSGLSGPLGLAIFGGNLYVANAGSGTIGEYTMSGATVNAALITGLNGPWGIAVVPDSGGTWIKTASGELWSTASNWSNGVVADGQNATADFSTLDITADITVHLDSARTVGSLIFGDTTASNNWILDNNGIAANTLTLAVSSGTPTITVNNQTATISAALAGNQGLIKNGNGTLILSGSNTFTGGLTVQLGTLEISTINDVNTDGPLGHNTAVTLGSSGQTATLEYGGVTASSTMPFTLAAGGTGAFQVDASTSNLTLSGVIGGSGAMIKTGNGTLILTGSNAFTGGLTVQLGTLEISTINNVNTNGPLGHNTAITLGSSGQTATLQYSGVTASSTMPFTLATGGTGAFQIDASTSNLTLSGVIGGSGAMIKTGNGTLILTGTNTYTGGTAVSAGTLQGNTNSLQRNIANNSNVTFNQSANGTYSGSISGSGSLTLAGTGTLTLSGVNSFTGGLTINDAGILAVGNDGALNSNTPNLVTFGPGSTGQLSLSNHDITVSGLITDANVGTPVVKNVSGSASLTINVAANASDTYNGVLAGSGTPQLSLIKTGSGTQILGGSQANTFDGSVSVNDGTLIFNKSAGVQVLKNTLTIGDGSGFPGSAKVRSESSHQFPSSINVVIKSDGELDFDPGLAESFSNLTMTGGTLKTGGANSSISVSSFTNGGGTISLGADTVTVANASSNSGSGVISLKAGAVLAGGGTITNSASIQGIGAVSNAVTNSGTIQAIGGTLTLSGTLQNLAAGLMTTSSATDTLSVTKGLVTNAGRIILNGGTFDNNNHALTNTNTSQITGFGDFLTGTGGLVNNGTINAIGGTLSITANSLQNPAGAQLSAFSGGTLFVTNGLVTNGGIINLAGGSFDNNGHALTNTGQVTGFGGFSTGGTGLDNKGIVTFTGGPTTVTGNVTNESNIVVNTDPATFNGVVSNIMGGTINTMNNATVTFAGGFKQTGSGTKTGSGVLNVTGTGAAPVTIENSSSLSINQGTTIIKILSGTATIGTGVLVTVSGSATLELAGAISDLSNNTNRAGIANSSTAPGLIISGTNQVVGGVDGAGSTQVNGGSNLQANHIVQTSLVIGGSAGAPGEVTIAPSDAMGQSHAIESDSTSSILNSLAAAGSPLPVDGAIWLTGTTDGSSADSTHAAGSAMTDAGAFGRAAAVPEPSSLLLFLLAAGCAAAVRARRR